MLLIKSLLLALPLLTEPADLPQAENEFNYYYGEFLSYAMEDSHPMARLIRDRLAEATFQANSNEELQNRLRLIKTGAQDNPELLGRFTLLDEKLKGSFTTRVSKGKQKRLIYTAAGAVIGAVIALPVGKLIASHSTLGMKALWIAVPIGALTGAGAGFLLGGLLDMPRDIQDKDFLSKDLQVIREGL